MGVSRCGKELIKRGETHLTCKGPERLLRAERGALVAVVPEELEGVVVHTAGVLQEARLVGDGGIALEDAVRQAGDHVCNDLIRRLAVRAVICHDHHVSLLDKHSPSLAMRTLPASCVHIKSFQEDLGAHNVHAFR